MKNRPKTRHPKHSRRSCRPILPRRSKGQSPKNKPYAEKPAYGTDTHGTAARKTARKERRGRSPEGIAKERTKDHRENCEEKKERNNYKGKGWKRSSRDSGSIRFDRLRKPTEDNTQAPHSNCRTGITRFDRVEIRRFFIGYRSDNLSYHQV